ncbi:MAG: DUF1801 domain-containing protein [Ignavibacteriae bacterium]|nr:DUF1801 domain-containing protein [Ignavibacteriota bacterium]
MYELKTKLNDANVENFLNKIEDADKKNLSLKVLDLMKKVTKEEPKMWGTSIIGFGSYHYKYKTGHEGDMCLVGFSPRKQNVTLYLTYDVSQYGKILEKLGKVKTGKSCLYVKKEEDIDFKVLEDLISKAYDYMKNMKWD